MNARIRQNGAVFAILALAAFTLSAPPSMAQQQQDPSQQSTGDPVADAARKAREQKKKETTKPKKVYTDDDMNHSISADAPASADANAPAGDNNAKAADAQGKETDDKASNPKESSETRWRRQFKAAYAKLDVAQKELDILQREDNKAQLQYYSDPQKALTEQYTRDEINTKDAKIATKKKEIDHIKQQISDMEDALRKSGGDPGWATP
jgi:hypothetical protein